MQETIKSVCDDLEQIVLKSFIPKYNGLRHLTLHEKQGHVDNVIQGYLDQKEHNENPHSDLEQNLICWLFLKRALPELNNNVMPDRIEYTLKNTCQRVRNVLLEKNRSYGDSANNPLRIFSRADAVEQINIRIDDKLSRLARGKEFDKDDTELDLIGYLVLKFAVIRKHKKDVEEITPTPAPENVVQIHLSSDDVVFYNLTNEIADERRRQVMIGYTAKTDDDKPLDLWVDVIESYVLLTQQRVVLNQPKKCRKYLLKIAALAIAACESYDRKESNQ